MLVAETQFDRWQSVLHIADCVVYYWRWKIGLYDVISVSNIIKNFSIIFKWLYRLQDAKAFDNVFHVEVGLGTC